MDTNLRKGDIVITKKKVNFGQKSDPENPVEKVLFFNKAGQPITYSLDEMKGILPAKPISETLLVMCRREQEDIDAVREARALFEVWHDSKIGGKASARKRPV